MHRAFRAALAAGTVLALVGLVPPTPASAAPPTLAESSQPHNRRFVVTGDRFFQVGAADGSCPGTGWPRGWAAA